MSHDYLTVADVLGMHAVLMQRYGGAMGVRDPGALEAALFRPQTGYYDDIVAEAAALAAADRATSPWSEDAMDHFRKAAEENFIALPSGKTKVSWDFSDPEHLVLVIRVASPITQRAQVEQAVFRDTWHAIHQASPPD